MLAMEREVPLWVNSNVQWERLKNPWSFASFLSVCKHSKLFSVGFVADIQTYPHACKVQHKNRKMPCDPYTQKSWKQQYWRAASLLVRASLHTLHAWLVKKTVYLSNFQSCSHPAYRVLSIQSLQTFLYAGDSFLSSCFSAHLAKPVVLGSVFFPTINLSLCVSAFCLSLRFELLKSLLSDSLGDKMLLLFLLARCCGTIVFYSVICIIFNKMLIDQ